jgi:hypothetical protein
MMFAFHFDNTLFAFLLFEGICLNNSKNESISLQRAMLGAGLQNRTPYNERRRSKLVQNELRMYEYFIKQEENIRRRFYIKMNHIVVQSFTMAFLFQQPM